MLSEKLFKPFVCDAKFVCVCLWQIKFHKWMNFCAIDNLAIETFTFAIEFIFFAVFKYCLLPKWLRTPISMCVNFITESEFKKKKKRFDQFSFTCYQSLSKTVHLYLRMKLSSNNNKSINDENFVDWIPSIRYVYNIHAFCFSWKECSNHPLMLRRNI